ncbi:MAG: hypothetical protein ACYS8W_16140 [Planctomycetota bacterium]|jgi:hypothetical protein
MNENNGQMKQSPEKRVHFPTKTLVLVVALIILTIVGVFAFLAYRMSDMHSEFVNFALPGMKELELTETGFYSVYYEYQSRLDGKYYNSPNMFPDMKLSLKKKGEEKELVINRPENRSASYSWGDKSGKLQFEFAINEPGAYEFAGKYDAGNSGPELVLSVGQEDFGSFLWDFLVAGVVAIIMICIVALILILNFHKFHRWLLQK